ncbi:hypothetical protein [Aquimonas sp.]|jgi:hypothetical protein|uniref:hypothetical protein n=1 Tax=Aquimonas sp. TaxID=1872588 RepID=UPI0037C1217F
MRRHYAGACGKTRPDPGFFIQPGVMDDEARTVTLSEDANADGVTDDVVDELIELVQAHGGDIAFLSASTLGNESPLGNPLRVNLLPNSCSRFL